MTAEAKPGDWKLIEEGLIRKRCRSRAIAGFVCGLLIGCALTAGVLKAKAEVIDPLMEAACKSPRHEGELTLMLVFNQQLVCWRMK